MHRSEDCMSYRPWSHWRLSDWTLGASCRAGRDGGLGRLRAEPPAGNPRLRRRLSPVLCCRHDRQPGRGGAIVRSAVLSPLSGVDARRSAPLALPADDGPAHGAAGAAFLRRGPGRLVGDPSRLHPCHGRDFLPHHAAAAALADQHARGPGRTAAAVDRRGHRPPGADAPAGPGRRIDAAQAGKTRLGRAGCSRFWP